MKKALAVLCVVCGLLSGCIPSQRLQDAPGRMQTQAEASRGWVEGLLMGVREDDAGVTVIFLNTHSQPEGLAPGVWHDIDVVPLGIPRDVLSIFMSGILIITHGRAYETCDITLAFRGPGSATLAGNYIFQTVESSLLGGQRSNASAMIPVKGGKFQMQWNQSSPRDKAYPEVCAYGANIRVQMYLRKGVTVRLEPMS